MIGFLLDLGRTILDNKGYNYENAMRNVYNLTNKKITFNVFFEKERMLHNYVFKLVKKTNTEVVIGEYLLTLIKLCDLETIYTSLDLEIAFFDELTKYEGVLGGAEKFLKFLKDRGAYVVAVSNSCISSDVLKRGLEKIKILKYFDEVISSADVLYRKPNQMMFLEGIKIMTEKKISIDNMYFVGNDYRCDISGAYNVGLKSIWYNEKNEEDVNNYATFKANNYDEIINYLQNNVFKA